VSAIYSAISAVRGRKGRAILFRCVKVALVLLLLLPGTLSLFRKDFCRFPWSALVPALLLPESDSPVRVLYYGHSDISRVLPELSEYVSEVRLPDSGFPEGVPPDLILLERLPQFRTVSDRKFLKEMIRKMNNRKTVLVMPLRCAAALPPEVQRGVLLPGGEAGAGAYIALRAPGSPPPDADAGLLEQRWLRRFDEGQRPLAGIFRAVYHQPQQQVQIDELRRKSPGWPFSVNIWYAVVPAAVYLICRFFLRRSENGAGCVDRLENTASLLLVFSAAIYYASVRIYIPEFSCRMLWEAGNNHLWMLAGIIPLFFSWKKFGSRRTAALVVVSAVALWNNEFFGSGLLARPAVDFFQWFIPLLLASAAAGAVSAVILNDLPDSGRMITLLSSVAGLLPVVYVAVLFMAYGRIEIVLAAATLFRLAGLQRCAES